MMNRREMLQLVGGSVAVAAMSFDLGSTIAPNYYVWGYPPYTKSSDYICYLVGSGVCYSGQEEPQGKYVIFSDGINVKWMDDCHMVKARKATWNEVWDAVEVAEKSIFGVNKGFYPGYFHE